MKAGLLDRPNLKEKKRGAVYAPVVKNIGLLDVSQVTRNKNFKKMASVATYSSKELYSKDVTWG